MSEREQIPRLDPDNRMGLEFHAPRALGRKKEDGTPEFEGLEPQARLEAVDKASFRQVDADATRNRLKGMLNRIDGVRTPEQQAFLDRLMGQREAAACVWKEKYPIKGAPDKARIVDDAERFLHGLSPEILQGFLDICPESDLVVVPGDVSVEKLVEIMKKAKIYDGSLWNNVKSDGWKFAVSGTGSGGDMPFDPSIFYVNPAAPEEQRQKRTNEEMVEEYERRFGKKGLSLMPQDGYLPSAAGQMAQGKVLDRQFWTAFKRPEGAVFLPDAFWGGGEVKLNNVSPDSSNGNLRCRPWFEGEMSL